jgi:hypothetical protein
MNGNGRRKHVTKLKNDREVAYMNDVGYHTYLNQVTDISSIQVLLVQLNNELG